MKTILIIFALSTHAGAVDIRPYSLSPASGDSTYVNVTGDTMTGQLTLSGSTLTVTGAQGVNVTYGVTAGTFTGNGAALTALTAANLTGTVPVGLVDLSTVTTALAGKLTAPATFYITKLSESLTAPATFYVVKNTDYLVAPATFTYQIPGDYITSLTGAVTASGPGAAATTIVSVPSAAINLSTVTANHVLKAGDTMTGPLTLSASTLTVTGSAFSVGGSTLIVSGGKVGIGNTAPGSKLHVTGDATISTSLTASSITANGNISTYGGVLLSSTAIPTITCDAGTGTLVAASTNQAGQITAGTSANLCTVTFSAAWPTTPFCVVTHTNEGTAPLQVAVDTTAVVIKGSPYPTSISDKTIAYICMGAR